jgi:pimeloyl-ACP methyl ester carboxylesterase
VVPATAPVPAALGGTAPAVGRVAPSHGREVLLPGPGCRTLEVIATATHEGQAMYLGTEPEPTFAMIHLPERARAGTTGVVFAPLYGWDDICTHRSRRNWARALAEAGHPAIRLDLPGTGDSPGSPHAPDRLETWIGSVSAAAAWLRADGCARVAAIGIGFGGMLAWLAAAQEAPIDDLVLWAVPTRGRRLVRGIHLASKLSIDTRIGDQFLASHPPAADAADCLLDEAGQLATPETVAALEAIDLLKTPLPDAERRNILVLERSGDTADAEFASHLRATGARVTVGDGDGYGRLMRYVQQSELPAEVVSGTIGWLGALPSEAATSPGTAPSTTTSVTLEHDGTPLRETAVTASLPSGPARGILTEPVGTRERGITVVFLSGSSDRRIGPNRMWVDAARRWAAQGVPALRFDPSGVGDSDGDEHGWDKIRDHYDGCHVDRTVELLDTLQQSGLPPRFVLVGFCSGAYRSLHTAARDPRVAGMFALGLPFFRWTHWAVSVRDSWLALWEPKAADSPRKVKIARTLQAALRIVHRAQHGVVRAAQMRVNHGESMLRRLDAQGTEVVLALKPASYANEQLEMPRRSERLRSLPRLRRLTLPNDDQRFRPLAAQRLVTDAVDEAIARVLADDQGCRSTAMP